MMNVNFQKKKRIPVHAVTESNILKLEGNLEIPQPKYCNFRDKTNRPFLRQSFHFKYSWDFFHKHHNLSKSVE